MPLIKRILSIDDQASICQMIQFTMNDLSDEQVEYEVDVASDGATGLDMAKKKQYGNVWISGKNDLIYTHKRAIVSTAIQWLLQCGRENCSYASSSHFSYNSSSSA